MTTLTIGFVGLTHLGLNSAIAAAFRGFEIVCYDSDLTLISALDCGELDVIEPDLPELLQKNKHRIRFTSDINVLSDCSLVYVAADVPTDDDGRSELELIDELIRRVDEVLHPENVLVILSQVPPGFTRARLRPGRLLFYQVETLIFGRAIERACFPERFIIGCSDPSKPLPRAFSSFLESFNCPTLAMRYESAELAKISINMCLVSAVSTANLLAELCEKIGADWSEIVPALKLDKRIGQFSYLSPGLGIAGGNLERDLVTVCNFADNFGTDASVIRSWIASSKYHRDWALRILHREVLSKVKDPVIAVLGLAYKQDTHSTKNSPSLALLEQIKQFQVRVFDPVVPSNLASNLHCHGAMSELEACDGADAVVVMTPWSQFGKLDLSSIANRLRGKLVIDPYAVFKVTACHKVGLTYFTLGAKF